MPAGTGQYRVAIVGTGHIARHRHIPAIRAQGDRIELVAVADVERDSATAFAEEFGVEHSGDDVAAMLAAARPDLVIVCTPPSAHHDGVQACLDAGSWVWCEKPPVLSLAEYDRLAGMERDGGPYVGYVFQHRFGSAARTLREQIAAGTLGRPLVGVCHTLWYRDHAYYEVPWRGKWETEGGGPTLGHGIHQMDLMLSLLGDWREIRAAMGTLDRRIDTEDVSLAAVTFESGAMVSVLNSVLSPREESYLRFDFTDATVEVSHTYGYDNSHWTWTPRKGVDEETAAAWLPTTDVPSSHAAQLEHFLGSMDRAERPAVSGPDGRRSLELITALYQSAITGQPVLRSELAPGNPFYDDLNGGGRYSAGVTAEVSR